jgi:hypothetical protein
MQFTHLKCMFKCIVTELYNHHHSQFYKIFIMPKRNPTPLGYYILVPASLPAPSGHQYTFCVYKCATFGTFHTNGIRQFVAFCVWLLPLSTVFLASHSSLGLKAVPLYGDTTFYSSINL